MKRLTAVLLASLMMFTATACSKAEEYKPVKGTMDVLLSSSASTAEYPEEKPDSNASVVLGESKEESNTTSSSQGSASASMVESSSQATEPEPSSSQTKAPTSSSSQKETAPVSSQPTSEKSGSSSALPEVSSQPPKPSSSQPSSQPASSKEEIKSTNTSTVTQSEENRAVWISYLDFQTILRGKSEAEFRSNIQEVFQDVAALDCNRVIVQVRPFSDALYYSDYFPMSHLVTGTEGKDAGFDPLKIMITYAHEADMQIEAWINPYRVRNAGTTAALASSSPAQKWINSGSDAVIQYAGGISYNPASSKARQLIVDGVAEIVENYDVDGIHFDDYFYPTTDSSFDKASYDQYKASGGKMALADWRRENVNILVRDVYAKIKSIDPKVIFGISPQGNVENNFNTQFIDVEKWLSNTGYVDYICPQIYFGFDNTRYPFAETVKLWNDMIQVNSITLYVGMSPYKIGLNDQWAGEGADEWQQSSNMLQRMVLETRKYKNCGGFFLYRYDSLFKPAVAVSAQVSKEISNLKSCL